MIIQSLFPALNGEGPSATEVEAYVQRLKYLKDAGAQIPLVQIYSATRPTPHSECGHLPLRTLSARILCAEGVRDLLARLYFGGIGLDQCGHDVRFYPWQGRINPSGSQRQIDQVVRWAEVVRRPIVTVYAVHCPDRVLRRIVFEISRAEFSDLTSGVGEANPGNGLPPFVCSNVFHLVGKVHVPVNAADRTAIRVTAADLEQQTHCEGRVRFVCQKMGIGAVEVADKFLRPMTFFTGFLRWTQISERAGSAWRQSCEGAVAESRRQCQLAPDPRT